MTSVLDSRDGEVEVGYADYDRHVLGAEAWRLIRVAVAKRRSLLHGKINSQAKSHCALGCFFADNPDTVISRTLADEVSTFNDSMPNVHPNQRWRRVLAWLRKQEKLRGVAEGEVA